MASASESIRLLLLFFCYNFCCTGNLKLTNRFVMLHYILFLLNLLTIFQLTYCIVCPVCSEFETSPRFPWILVGVQMNVFWSVWASVYRCVWASKVHSRGLEHSGADAVCVLRAVERDVTKPPNRWSCNNINLPSHLIRLHYFTRPQEQTACVWVCVK